MPHRTQGTAAIVLAGGKSTRFGADKAFLQFDGQPLVARTVARLSELTEELDPEVFLRIHRGTIVNAKYIDKVSHLPSSRGQLRLKDRNEIHTISRAYSSLFKHM